LSFSSFSEAFLFACNWLAFFLSLSAAAVSSVELFLVLYLWSRHHHYRSHVFVVQ
jgi:hypothetical protein